MNWSFDQIGGLQRDSALFENSSAISQGTVAGLSVFVAPGIAGSAIKAKSQVAAAAKTEAPVVTEGIYEFVSASGKVSVGQSVNISNRIAQHLASGKLLQADLATLRTTAVSGGKVVREVAEQLRINALGGISKLENVRNPIGKARAHLLGGP